jgi:hypothetical protein
LSGACETLLLKIHRSLTAGGRVITLEFVPDDDLLSPPIVAEFSLITLATTPGGDAYMTKAFEQMFRVAGFTRTELESVQGSFGADTYVL